MRRGDRDPEAAERSRSRCRSSRAVWAPWCARTAPPRLREMLCGEAQSTRPPGGRSRSTVLREQASPRFRGDRGAMARGRGGEVNVQSTSRRCRTTTPASRPCSTARRAPSSGSAPSCWTRRRPQSADDLVVLDRLYTFEPLALRCARRRGLPPARGSHPEPLFARPSFGDLTRSGSASPTNRPTPSSSGTRCRSDQT